MTLNDIVILQIFIYLKKIYEESTKRIRKQKNSYNITINQTNKIKEKK